MALSKEDKADIAALVWTTKPTTVGQQTGGALHEIDLRSASTETRLGKIETTLHDITDRLDAQDQKLDAILAAIMPPPA